MLLSAVSVLVVAQSSSEIPEGLMNNPVLVKCINKQNMHFDFITYFYLLYVHHLCFSWLFVHFTKLITSFKMILAGESLCVMLWNYFFFWP